MRIVVTPGIQHKEACAAVGWSLAGELFSCGDDCSILKWNMNGEPLGKVCELDVCFTGIKFLPSTNNQRRGNAAEMFVVSCTDGTFRFINTTSGRVDLTKEAHQGAVVCCAWNWDGTALVTGGEEGLLKLWSQSGQLRATLADTKGHCVHNLAWGPENDQVLYTCGKDLIIKPLAPSSKQLQWKAHDGVILAVDWSPVTNLIVSGAEDGKYKVWDAYGRQLYQSVPLDFPITSLAFSPDGEMFAVGSYNMLRICDKTGWSHCRNDTVFHRGKGKLDSANGFLNDDTIGTGSILNISWTADCTQVACGGGTGVVCFGQLVDRRVEYKNLIVTLTEATRVRVQNVLTDNAEDIERPDKIIKLSIGYGYLIVATSTQCCIYDVQRLQSPVVFDVKDKVALICQAEKLFMVMDHFTGLQVFHYDGRNISTIKLQGVRTEFLNYQSVSLSPETVAIKDAFNPKSVQIYEIQTGKQNTQVSIQHQLEILEVSLSQYGAPNDRKCALVDRNKDLWICSVFQRTILFKLATMVASLKWNDTSEVLIALADGKLAVWYYPSVVFIDKDLLGRVKTVKEETDFGRNDQLLDFFGSRCKVRRGSDGAVLTFSVRPYPTALFGHVVRNEWDSAKKLCRCVKSECLWSILAALAVKMQDLPSAEVAYAALEEVDKLQYIKYIEAIRSPEARSAELMLFQRRAEDAEKILLQANLIYRAIRLHIRLYNWDRALDIAIQYKTHVDTVIGYRKKYLKNFNKEETNKKYLQDDILKVEVNWDLINQKIAEERRKEDSGR